jgi:predicted dehydrogenase
LEKQENTMKVAFVGCGLNSDYHINFAKDYLGIEMVGVVDKDGDKARRCASKYGISRFYSEIHYSVNKQLP